MTTPILISRRYGIPPEGARNDEPTTKAYPRHYLGKLPPSNLLDSRENYTKLEIWGAQKNQYLRFFFENFKNPNYYYNFTSKVVFRTFIIFLIF